MIAKENKKRRLTVPALAGLFLFLAVALSFAIRQAEVRSIDAKLAALEEEILRYQNSNETLQRRAELLLSDEYIERIAREKLGLVKPGEVQYMLINQKRSD